MPKRKHSVIGSRSAKARKYRRRASTKYRSIAPSGKYKRSSRGGRIRTRIRRVRRGRGVRRVGRRGRGTRVSPYGSVRPTGFRKKLNLELGNKFLLSRVAQCEFQVQKSSDWSGGSGTQEPMAQYCFVREPKTVANGGSEIDAMIYPWNYTDIQYIIDNCMPSNQMLYQNAILFKNFFTCGYTANYSFRNQTNYPTRVEILRFRCRRDIYRKTDSNHYDYLNPLNIAGQYLNRLQDAYSTDAVNATNKALHTNRVRFEQLPPIAAKFSCRKKTRTLSPGQVVNYKVSARKTFNMFDLVGDTNVGVSATWAHQQWYGGTKWMMFKMLSDSADYTGSSGETGEVLGNTSTRTTPVGLLSYEIKYDIAVPNQSRETVQMKIATIGMTGSIADGTISNMADSDEKEVAQIVVD